MPARVPDAELRSVIGCVAVVTYKTLTVMVCKITSILRSFVLNSNIRMGMAALHRLARIYTDYEHLFN